MGKIFGKRFKLFGGYFWFCDIVEWVVGIGERNSARERGFVALLPRSLAGRKCFEQIRIRVLMSVLLAV
jgi:hypothetical protein